MAAAAHTAVDKALFWRTLWKHGGRMVQPFIQLFAASVVKDQKLEAAAAKVSATCELSVLVHSRGSQPWSAHTRPLTPLLLSIFLL